MSSHSDKQTVSSEYIIQSNTIAFGISITFAIIMMDLLLSFFSLDHDLHPSITLTGEQFERLYLQPRDGTQGKHFAQK